MGEALAGTAGAGVRSRPTLAVAAPEVHVAERPILDVEGADLHTPGSREGRLSRDSSGLGGGRRVRGSPGPDVEGRPTRFAGGFRCLRVLHVPSCCGVRRNKMCQSERDVEICEAIGIACPATEPPLELDPLSGEFLAYACLVPKFLPFFLPSLIRFFSTASDTVPWAFVNGR